MDETERWKEINEWLGDTGKNLDDVMEVAFARHKVKKGRRLHYEKVIREAFDIALERAKRG